MSVIPEDLLDYGKLAAESTANRVLAGVVADPRLLHGTDSDGDSPLLASKVVGRHQPKLDSGKIPEESPALFTGSERWCFEEVGKFYSGRYSRPHGLGFPPLVALRASEVVAKTAEGAALIKELLAYIPSRPPITFDFFIVSEDEEESKRELKRLIDRAYMLTGVRRGEGDIAETRAITWQTVVSEDSDDPVKSSLHFHILLKVVLPARNLRPSLFNDSSQDLDRYLKKTFPVVVFQLAETMFHEMQHALRITQSEATASSPSDELGYNLYYSDIGDGTDPRITGHTADAYTELDASRLTFEFGGLFDRDFKARIQRYVSQSKAMFVFSDEVARLTQQFIAAHRR